MESTFNMDLSENVAYDIPSFPSYIRKGFLSLYPNFTANSHWHTDLEFIILLNGTMSYNINGEIITLHSGNGVLINSRHLHYGFSSTQEECEFICILLHPSLLSGNAFFYHNYVESFLFRTDTPYINLNQEIIWQSQIISILTEMYNKKSCADNTFTIIEGLTRIL